MFVTETNKDGSDGAMAGLKHVFFDAGPVEPDASICCMTGASIGTPLWRTHHPRARQLGARIVKDNKTRRRARFCLGGVYNICGGVK